MYKKISTTTTMEQAKISLKNKIAVAFALLFWAYGIISVISMLGSKMDVVVLTLIAAYFVGIVYFCIVVWKERGFGIIFLKSQTR